MKKSVKILSSIAAIATIISTLTGLFYTYGGQLKTVTNIYGQKVQLFGDGIYANDTLMKAATTKGTDMVMLVIAAATLIMVFGLSNKSWARILHVGLLSCLLYSSTCLIMGISFNRLFLVYLVQFSTTLFAFVLELLALGRQECFQQDIYKKKQKGTAAFLIIGGCSVLVWLTLIIPALLSGMPTGFIEIYTTEPTYAIDLGILLPTCIFCGAMLLKQKKTAYLLSSVLMTLVCCVGLCVIAQTIMQMKMGIVLNAGQYIGLVLSFVLLGTIAAALNLKLLKHTKHQIS